jgi:RNA polymerase sigma-70 factor (ECF subfamily)
MEEEKEFKKLYQRYRTRLLYFILRKVEKLEDAEEILQDTFISALDSLPLFSRKKKLKTIVFSRFPQLEKIVSQALSPEAALEAKELEEEVVQCLKGLSEGYARILRLKYIDGLSYRQIAKKLKKPVKAIESKLSRARKASSEKSLC